MKIISVFLFLSLCFLPAKKSEAGIIILTSSPGNVGVATGVVLGSAGFIGSVMSIQAMTHVPDGWAGAVALFMGVPSVVLLALDADGSLPQNALMSMLSDKYPFIENPEILVELAKLIRVKALDQNFVSITANEIETILAPMDLTGLEAEMAAMIKDLE